MRLSIRKPTYSVDRTCSRPVPDPSGKSGQTILLIAKKRHVPTKSWGCCGLANAGIRRFDRLIDGAARHARLLYRCGPGVIAVDFDD